MLDIIYVDNIKIFQVFIPFNLTNSEISQETNYMYFKPTGINKKNQLRKKD